MSRRRGVGRGKPHDVDIGPVAGSTQDDLRAAVVLVRQEPGLVPEHRQTRERTGRLADVALGGHAGAEGEPLEQGPRQGEVGRRLAVGVGIEGEPHRRLLHDGRQERLEPAQGVLAKLSDVPRHQPAVLDQEVPRGEVAVPEEGHLLLRAGGASGSSSAATIRRTCRP